MPLFGFLLKLRGESEENRENRRTEEEPNCGRAERVLERNRVELLKLELE